MVVLIFPFPKIQGDGMLTKKEFQYALKNSMKAASILMQYQMKKMMEAQAGITFGGLSSVLFLVPTVQLDCWPRL